MKKIPNHGLSVRKCHTKLWLVMRLTLLLIVGLVITVSGNSYSQATRLSLSFQKEKIADIIEAIENQSEFVFLYKKADFDVNKEVTFIVKEGTIDQILEQMTKGQEVAYEVHDRQILISKHSIPTEFPQPARISGVVLDNYGQPVVGASVSVKGTTLGTVTNINGEFNMTVPENAKILLVSFIGLSSQELEIAGKTTFNIVLKEDVIGVDEVMVVAYGTAKRSSFTGSAAVVGAEKLETRTITSVTQALEGSTTGVQVTSTGQPGSSPEIRIRGYGTLNGEASPLYIVDGAQYEGSIANLSPDDIESMTILKDASSTALYGARAANGIVMITTKKGRSTTGMSVQVKAVAGVVMQAIPYYETANPQEYYELMFQAYKNSLVYSGGKTPEVAAQTAATGIFNQLKYNPFNVADNQIVDANGVINPNATVKFPSLDWYDPISQTGYRQNYNLSASGAGEKHDYFFSLGYHDEEGYVVGSNYERVNARININMTPKKWLKFGTNFSGTLTKRGIASGTTGNTSYGNPFFFARNMGAIYPVYMVDPATGNYILDAAGEKQYDLGGGYSKYNINSRPAGANPGRHIIAELDFNSNETLTNNISNRTFAEFTIMKGLSLSTNVSIDINNLKDAEFENQIVGDGAPTGRYNQTRYVRTVKNWNQLLNYQNTFANNHNVEFLLGHESFDRHYSEMYGMKTQLIVEGIYEFDNFVTPTSLSGYSSDKRTESYFSRLNYNYKDKYYFSASYRRDGSSVFHKDVRWGGFYSVGASWRVSEESFIKNLGWVDQLKVRSSYGQVGNDNIGSFYAYQALYATLPNAEAPGLDWSKIGNSELTWESNNSFDVAVEFNLFNNKLHGLFEFYKKDSKDLLYDQPLVPSMGLSSQPRNIATLYNQGLEISLGSTVVKNRDYLWDINLQMSTVKNEITEIPDPFVSGSKRWDVGHSIYDYYLYDYYGVNAETGAALYHVWKSDESGVTSPQYNENGDPVLSEKYTDSEKGYTGDSAIPDLFGSLINTVKYKNFQLDFMFTYSLGGKILDYNYADLMNEGDYGNAIHKDQLNGWRKAGDVTDIPRLEYGNSNINPTSDRWLTDASYLALKNVNISYSFNQKKIKDFGIKELKVFATGENLFMMTARKGMDPQEAFSGTTSNVYLPSRVFSLGVNVSF